MAITYISWLTGIHDPIARTGDAHLAVQGGGNLGEYQPELGRLVRSLREKQMLSLDSAAAKAKIDKRTFSRIENGQAVQPSSLLKVCDFFGGADKVRQLLEDSLTAKDELEMRLQRRLPLRDLSFSQITKHLDEIDDRIGKDFKHIVSPTRGSAPTTFSSRKLISSLSALGIPLEIVLTILDALPDELHSLVERKIEPISTNHVRAAVMRLITNLSPSEIASTELFRLRQEIAREGDQMAISAPEKIRFDWSARYARRFGAASQAIQVIERDGKVSSLDYSFLRNTLLPHAMRRLLGRDFPIEGNSMVSYTIMGEMAESILDEFKRLGLYTIRYKTALRLAEDIAMHPPHPWVVVDSTRAETIDYDLQRARANIERLVDPAESARIDIEYRHSEALRHACSAILGIYSAYLGNKDTSAIHLLHHWLGLDEANPILWQSCSLRLIDSDLQAIGVEKQELTHRLKRLGLPQRATASELAERCTEFVEMVERLRLRRAMMDAAARSAKSGDPISLEEALAIVHETVMVCFGCRRLKSLQDSSRSRNIGFLGTVRTAGSALEGLPPSTVFLLCDDPTDVGCVERVVSDAVDQLAAHRSSRTALILTMEEPNSLIKRRIEMLRSDLMHNEQVAVGSVFTLREQRSSNVPIEEIIDSLFA